MLSVDNKVVYPHENQYACALYYHINQVSPQTPGVANIYLNVSITLPMVAECRPAPGLDGCAGTASCPAGLWIVQPSHHHAPQVLL